MHWELVVVVSGNKPMQAQLLKPYGRGKVATAGHYQSIFFYWHDRMWSLHQGVLIWSFEEKTKQSKKKKKKKKNKENLLAVFLNKWGVP